MKWVFIKFQYKRYFWLITDELKTVPADLSKLSNVVNNIVKKTVYNKLVVKVNDIDTSGVILKTKYQRDKSDLQTKISDADKRFPGTSKLVEKTYYSSKISETEVKYLVLVVQLQPLH